MLLYPDNHYVPLAEEFANRVIRGPGCKECLNDDGLVGYMPSDLTDAERFVWQAGFQAAIASMREGFGFEPNEHNTGYHRPCASCRVRRPYAWLKHVPLPRFAARMRDIEAKYGGHAWPLHELDGLKTSSLNPVMRGDDLEHLKRGPRHDVLMTNILPGEPPLRHEHTRLSLAGATPELVEAIRTGDFSEFNKPIVPIKNDREFF